LSIEALSGDFEKEVRAAAEAVVQTARTIVEQQCAPGAVEARTAVVAGPAAPALLDAAAGADLLVVGSHGHGTFAGLLLGSVSLHCATHSPCPVVVVRGRAAD
jgi:nucleotide-binding universal stress UspA family protein